jgi:8-oxo-dGTP pyrophosphatase MutT (NUDIX family)
MYQIETLITALENHAVKFRNEKSFADRMITFLRENQERAFHNYHWDDGHITASMLITNPSRTKVLLMLHKKIKKWLQFGGHSDDSPEVLATAIREFHEESGILVEPDIFSYESGLPIPIFDLDIHKVPADLK